MKLYNLEVKIREIEDMKWFVEDRAISLEEATKYLNEVNKENEGWIARIVECNESAAK